MRVQRAADGPTVEHDRVQRYGGESEAHAVENPQDLHGFALDASFLVNLFDRHLGRRVADVGPTRWVEPVPGVRALYEKYLAPIVPDHRTDRHFRGDITRHPQSDALHPFRPQLLQGTVSGCTLRSDRHAHVGRDVEDFLVTLALVLALGEAESGAGDAGEALAPAEHVSMTNIRCGAGFARFATIHDRHPNARPPTLGVDVGPL